MAKYAAPDSFARIGIRRLHRFECGIMHRLRTRIAKQLAEFRKHNTEPDYEEQARIILQIVNEDRQAEIHEWRAQQNGQAWDEAK